MGYAKQCIQVSKPSLAIASSGRYKVFPSINWRISPLQTTLQQQVKENLTIAGKFMQYLELKRFSLEQQSFCFEAASSTFKIGKA